MNIANKNSIRKMTVTAIMAAISFILMALEFGIPIVPSFLKYDFSDLPALITSFAIGPVYAVIVELVKNVLHLMFTATGGVGELANFLVGSALVFPAGLIYKYKKTRSGAVIGAVIGAIFGAAVSFPVNFYITYPFYSNFMPMEQIIGAYKLIIPSIDTLPKALLAVNFPFTFVKGAVNAVITFAVYKKLSPIIKPK